MRVTCPHCWQPIDIEEPAYDEQGVTFTADCEVCCRPILVSVDWPSPGAPPDVTAEAE